MNLCTALAAFLLCVIYFNRTGFAQPSHDTSFSTRGKFEDLLECKDVEFYRKAEVPPFDDSSGLRRRYFVCMNSLSVIITTETIKNAYPASYLVVFATRVPSTGIYQFQEVDKERLTELGIELDLISKAQKLNRGMGRSVQSFFQVSIRPENVVEFERLMFDIPVRNSSELSKDFRILGKKTQVPVTDTID